MIICDESLVNLTKLTNNGVLTLKFQDEVSDL